MWFHFPEAEPPAGSTLVDLLNLIRAFPWTKNFGLFQRRLAAEQERQTLDEAAKATACCLIAFQDTVCQKLCTSLAFSIIHAFVPELMKPNSSNSEGQSNLRDVWMLHWKFVC